MVPGAFWYTGTVICSKCKRMVGLEELGKEGVCHDCLDTEGRSNTRLYDFMYSVRRRSMIYAFRTCAYCSGRLDHNDLNLVPVTSFARSTENVWDLTQEEILTNYNALCGQCIGAWEEEEQGLCRYKVVGRKLRDWPNGLPIQRWASISNGRLSMVIPTQDGKATPS